MFKRVIYIILNEKQQLEVSGGGVNFSVIGAIGAAIAFLISAIDGFLNPTKCG